jgi:hypothetical protein
MLTNNILCHSVLEPHWQENLSGLIMPRGLVYNACMMLIYN